MISLSFTYFTMRKKERKKKRKNKGRKKEERKISDNALK